MKGVRDALHEWKIPAGRETGNVCAKLNIAAVHQTARGINCDKAKGTLFLRATSQDGYVKV